MHPSTQALSAFEEAWRTTLVEGQHVYLLKDPTSLQVDPHHESAIADDRDVLCDICGEVVEEEEEEEATVLECDDCLGLSHEQCVIKESPVTADRLEVSPADASASCSWLCSSDGPCSVSLWK